MRFSVGGGIGPFRVSQTIGGRNNSRPGYFAQFEMCTINHRSEDTRRRCGRKHPPTAAEVAAAAARQAEIAARKQALVDARSRVDMGTHALDDYNLVAVHHRNEFGGGLFLALLLGGVMWLLHHTGVETRWLVLVGACAAASVAYAGHHIVTAFKVPPSSQTSDERDAEPGGAARDE